MFLSLQGRVQLQRRFTPAPSLLDIGISATNSHPTPRFSSSLISLAASTSLLPSLYHISFRQDAPNRCRKSAPSYHTDSGPPTITCFPISNLNFIYAIVSNRSRLHCLEHKMLLGSCRSHKTRGPGPDNGFVEEL